MSKMIEVRGLTKRFGSLTAVDGISLSVDRGEVLGFLGPNGAGKSTTMKMVTGFLPPTAGTAMVCGFDVAREPLEVKRRVGYLPEGAPLYEDMTPQSFLNFVTEVRAIPGDKRPEAIRRAAEMINITDVLHQPIGTLSKGYKRRVGLAQAIVHDPEVLILDEPTDGLDPNQKHEVRSLITQMAANKAIVISTHLLDEVDAVCSRAVIISRGKVVTDGTPEELLAQSRYHNAVSIRIASDLLATTRETLSAIDGVGEVNLIDEVESSALLLVTPKSGGLIMPQIADQVRSGALVVEEIVAERGRLDEVFRMRTMGE